jgi:hypothetical protein
MSNRYKGGIISATPPTTTGGNDGVASGSWTLEQQYQAQGAGVWPNQPIYYIEDVFSTYLYTGNQTNRSIVNNIDLSTKGGMVWIKTRSVAGLWSIVVDTNRGATPILNTTTTAAASNASSTQVTSFNANGFSLGTDSGNYGSNGPSYLIASWTFRKQPKFFDVVTFTSGAGTQTISHNLGATVGMIIVKCTTVSDSWYVWHRSIPNNALALNTNQSTSTFTNPEYSFGNGSVVVQPTSTQFTFYAGNSGSNTYVAYIYAHDAGGFGLTGTDNVISCGSYTGNGSATGPIVTLGYEPQWLLIKNATASPRDWYVFDNMRGMTVGSVDSRLSPNNTDAEDNTLDILSPTATGFEIKTAAGAWNGNGDTMIYIAIRRGPMKVPTSGTSIYNAIARTGTGTTATITSTITPDFIWTKARSSGAQDHHLFSRLRGALNALTPARTDAEFSYLNSVTEMNNSTFKVVSANDVNTSATTYINWIMSRAPGFMDEVCYVGTGSATTVTHNLGTAPELIIIKKRSSATNSFWVVYSGALGVGKIGYLHLSNAFDNAGINQWNNTSPTSTVFSLGSQTDANSSGDTFVAHLFATCPGVSKVGTYTGNGSSQTINCDFTSGARFVLIKRTDSTGDWYVWDTTRGIVTGNDPRLSWNTFAVEVTTDDTIDPDNTGFIVNQLAATNVNVTSATYIFLAIA